MNEASASLTSPGDLGYALGTVVARIPPLVTDRVTKGSENDAY